MEEKVLTREQYQDLSRELILSIEKKFRIVPLNSLKSSLYRLRCPIYITLEQDNDTVIACFEDIEAFSYAETESEAINLLCEEIAQVFQDLRENRENLGPLPKKWLDYLEEIIECK